MTVPDYAKAVKNALAADWAVSHPTWTATLDVDDDYQPVAGSPTVLIADDGGPGLIAGAWLVRATPQRPVLRMVAFAIGRTEAIETLDTAMEFVLDNKPGISRIESFPSRVVTRDRETGAYLASITVPVIVRQTA